MRASHAVVFLSAALVCAVVVAVPESNMLRGNTPAAASYDEAEVRDKALSERKAHEEAVRMRNVVGKVDQSISEAEVKRRENAKASDAKLDAIRANVRAAAENERRNRDQLQGDEPIKSRITKPTSSLESMEVGANDTLKEMRRAGSKLGHDRTPLTKAATEHQARLHQRAQEDRNANAAAREAAIAERTKRDLSGGINRKWDPKTTVVTHEHAALVPDVETCGVRHCRDEDFQLRMKFPRQTQTHFVEKCVKIYEDWKSTTGYNLDCKESPHGNSTEFVEPFPGFAALKEKFEMKMKAAQEENRKRLHDHAAQSASDGAAYHQLKTDEKAEQEKLEMTTKKHDKMGEGKIRRKQMIEKIQYETEAHNRRGEHVGSVYKNDTVHQVKRKRAVEEPPDEGWGPGYSISPMRL
jgi:hypothetical protein